MLVNSPADVMRSLSIADVVPVLNIIAVGTVLVLTVPSITPLIVALLCHPDPSCPAKLILPNKSVPPEAVGLSRDNPLPLWKTKSGPLPPLL